MPASFAYGRRDGRLIHVHDLDETRHRGLRCECVCPECGRVLQAHLGEQKAWHFQHHVEDANCNPQPMTLLHAFVRDELATRTQLHIPAQSVYSNLFILGEWVPKYVPVPAVSLHFTEGRAEVRGDGVQPDVVFKQENGTLAALEVRYSHAVDAEKLDRLRRNYVLSIEFDVADLPPAGINREQLEFVLKQPRRWTWLHSGYVMHAETMLRLRLEWQQTQWRPGSRFKEPPRVKPATQKLREVSRRLAWAEPALASIEHQAMPRDEAAQWLGAQKKNDRVAIACYVMGIDPQQLPPFMQQHLPADKPAYTLAHHPYSWQPVVFMKFCIGRREFTAEQAGEWCVTALPDRCEHEDGTKSLNGLTRTAAALQLYFLQLELQGLLQGTPGVPPEKRSFTPRFATPRELRAHLAELAQPA